MIAFKGFSKELRSVCGDGKKENCSFIPGETKKVKNCKTVREGFHCYENPFMLPTFYPLDGNNRYFKVRAEGNIDEDEDEKIACTELTLMEELTPWMIAMEGLKYMIVHPSREGWQKSFHRLTVGKDYAETEGKDSIAVARGMKPTAKGTEGSILGFLVDNGKEITDCKLIRVTAEQSGKLLTLKDREVVEIDEEKAD